MQTAASNKLSKEKILALTAATYKAPEGEEHLTHLRIYVKRHSVSTGELLSIPRIQKYSPMEIEQGEIIKLREQGYTVAVLHDGSAWMAEQNKLSEEERREIEAKKQQEAEEAAKEAKKAERAEIAKEVIEELRAQGMLKEPEAEKQDSGESDGENDGDKEPEKKPARKPGRPSTKKEETK